MPTTYVRTPHRASCATAPIVATSSRHEVGPAMAGLQQFTSGVHEGACSMLGMHLLASHVAAGLQLGPPSVARMTTVRPRRPASVGASRDNVAPVGVPPMGMLPEGMLIDREKARVTSPSTLHAPVGSGSPGRVGNTSSPVAHVSSGLTMGPGNTAAPTLTCAPSFRTRATEAVATASYFTRPSTISCMLPERSMTK